MKIAEIFYSIQGEGKLVGVPSVFVRVSGCNLRCTWCDTPYASWNPEGKDMPVPAIGEMVRGHGARHVVITGGEPMMFRETAELISSLKALGQHVTVETAGTLWLEGLEPGAIDLASISPKLANSTPREREGGKFAALHERQRINMDALRQFAVSPVIRERQWKFVISKLEDIGETEAIMRRISSALPAEIAAEDIVLMPEGVDAAALNERSRWLAEVCKEKGYRMSPRLHVHIWGNTRGT